MTQLIDTFLIDHGFEADEVAGVEHRQFLYLGIIFMSFLTLIFSSLAATAWL